MTILTCPFCGGKPYLESHQRGFVNGVSTHVCFVRCRECNARSPRVNLADYGAKSYSGMAIRDVVAAWNRRNYQPREIEFNEKGREMIRMEISRKGAV